MATKKNGPTLAAMNAQIAALQAQADAQRKKEVAEVIAKAKDAIVHYGLTAADPGLNKSAGNVGKSSAAVGSKQMNKGRKNAAAKPAAKATKFKDHLGHTWVDIGKRPDWLSVSLQGVTFDLSIGTTDPFIVSPTFCLGCVMPRRHRSPALPTA